MIRRTPLKRYKPLQRSTKPLKRTAIKRQTNEEATRKNQLSKVKKEIDLTEIQNNTYFCKGCGRSYPGLDKSHILSVGLYKHLELVKENMQLMCREGSLHSRSNQGCHTIWESGTMKEKMKLHCFVENIVAIHKLDYPTFNVFINEIEYLDYSKYLNIKSLTDKL